ncbi:MAG: M28 family peptidase [Oligoflexales bacterium]
MNTSISSVLLVSLCLFMSCGVTCSRSQNGEQVSDRIVSYLSSLSLDQKALKKDVEEISRSAHPLGSARQSQVAEFITTQATALGAKTTVQKFTAKTPNPSYTPLSVQSSVIEEKSAQNVLALVVPEQDVKCVVVVGSHFDTKSIKEGEYLGANDSGSSSAALLQMIVAMQKYPHKSDLTCAPLFVWFDGEEAQLENWTDGELAHPAKTQDNTYGSRHFVSELKDCDIASNPSHCIELFDKTYAIAGAVILDMIGSSNIKITNDLNSDTAMRQLMVSADKSLLGDESILMGGFGRPIEDDHVPFKSKSIPVLDMIDFENLDTWHQTTDEVSKVDPASIDRAARVATAVVLELLHNPEKAKGEK